MRKLSTLVSCTILAFLFSLDAYAQEPIINGEATLTITWTPPTQNEDSTALALSEIAGYVIYWDVETGVGRCDPYPRRRLDPCYSQALDLANGSLSSQTMTLNLTGDTDVFFAMAAYKLVDSDDDGNDELFMSAYSGELVKQFRVDITEPPTSPPGAPIIQSIDIQVTCTTDTPGVTCTFEVN